MGLQALASVPRVRSASPVAGQVGMGDRPASQAPHPHLPLREGKGGAHLSARPCEGHPEERRLFYWNFSILVNVWLDTTTYHLVG
jgi:hypothetical protein